MCITQANNGNGNGHNDEYRPTKTHEILSPENDQWAEMDEEGEVIDYFVDSQEVKDNLELNDETETDN